MNLKLRRAVPREPSGSLQGEACNYRLSGTLALGQKQVHGPNAHASVKGGFSRRFPACGLSFALAK